VVKTAIPTKQIFFYKCIRIKIEYTVKSMSASDLPWSLELAHLICWSY